MHPTRKAAIIALLLLILIALILAIKASLSSPMPGSPPTPSPLANKPAAPTSTPARLHVGLYLSKTTGDQWGYSCQIVFELSRGGFDLVPILEAGTENEKAIAKLLEQWFPGKKPVNASDAEALKKLDEATREVAAEELQKEADREVSTAFSPQFGVPVPGPDAVLGRSRPFRWKKGDPVPEPVDDEDPAGGPSMHDVMQGADVDDAPKS